MTTLRELPMPSWYHGGTPVEPPPEFRSDPDKADAAGRALVPLAESVADVFARCEWCRQPTPGVLADCADPACPGSAS